MCFSQKSQNVKCVIGSGFCAGHNVELTRSVKKKRVSNIGEDGKVTWTMREVTFLSCPATNLGVQNSGVNNAVISEQPENGKNNGKKRKTLQNVSDQPQPLYKVSGGEDRVHNWT